MIDKKIYIVRPMTAMESLECFVNHNDVIKNLCANGCDIETAKAIGENSALCAFSIMDENGDRVFTDAWEALNNMSLSEIASYANEYKIGRFDDIECGYNKSFGLDKHDEEH